MKDIHIRKTGKGNNARIAVKIKNECTIYNVEKLYKTIVETVAIEQIESITMEGVNNIDLAGVQFILAVKKAVHAAGQQCNVYMNVDEHLASLIQKCGLENIINN